jgi:hypothetical protein
MRRGLLALLAVLVGLLTAATAAFAAGSTGTTPPVEVIKYKGKVVQTTELYQFNWYYYSDSGFWVHTADRAPGAPPPTHHFPKAVLVQPHTRVNVVIFSARKPSTVTIRHFGWKNYFAKHLYPIKDKSGKVTKWGAYFTLREGKKLPEGTTDYRLKIRTAWPEHNYDSYGAEVRLAHLKTK